MEANNINAIAGDMFPSVTFAPARYAITSKITGFVHGETDSIEVARMAVSKSPALYIWDRCICSSTY